MLNLMTEVAVKGIHHGPSAGELFKGQGGNKFCRVFCHDDLHGSVELYQGRGQGCSLVGGNTTGYTQQDCLSVQHRRTSRLKM
jgi:hypothetical protein